jgi:hypothetical protein
VVKGNILLVVDDVPVIGDGTTKDHVGDTPTIPAKTITPMLLQQVFMFFFCLVDQADR